MDNEYLKKELGIFEIFRISRFIYDKNIKYMLLISVMFYLPMAIVTAFIPQYLVNSLIQLNELLSQVSSIDEANRAAFIYAIDINLWKNSFMCLLLETGIAAFFMPLSAGAATYITKQALQGKEVKRSELFDASVGKMGKYVFTTIVLYSILFVSAILIIPYIFFSVAFYFSQNAVADEGKWGFAAFKKSWQTVKGRWFKTLFFILIVFFLRTIVEFIFIFSESVVTSILLGLFGQFICLWFVVAVCVLYFNLNALSHKKKDTN